MNTYNLSDLRRQVNKSVENRLETNTLSNSDFVHKIFEMEKMMEKAVR